MQRPLAHAPNKLHKMGTAQSQLLKANYYSKVTLIDDCVGAIVQTLKDRSLLDNTWMVFSSDHGEMLGEHGWERWTIQDRCKHGSQKRGGFGWSRSGQMAACKLTPSIPVLIVEPLFNAMQE